MGMTRAPESLAMLILFDEATAVRNRQPNQKISPTRNELRDLNFRKTEKKVARDMDRNCHNA